jgi:WhiB family redox-sensing transcriptional regulator
MSKVVYVDPDHAAEWEEQALCRDVQDQTLFFPEHGNRSPAKAKRMCGRCPVRDECLEAALVNDERFGIWGGMTERERLDLRATVDAA